MTDQTNQIQSPIVGEKKYVKSSEFVLYLVAVFFYTTMTGMVGNFRNSYLVNVLLLENSETSLFNTLIRIIPFILNFFIVMYIDGRKAGTKGKFKPLAIGVAIPMGILLILTFFTPGFISNLSRTVLLIYLVTVAVGWSISTCFGNSVNMVAVVMTPNMKERDKIMSFRGISSAIGNSAPLVIVLVIGLIFKNESTQYIIGAGLCGVIGIITMLFGMSIVKERTAYAVEKKNPLLGFKDILANKHAWIIIVSETVKTFREIATYMGIFLAAALLGSPSKFLLFGLPTGIGTAVGMLVINFLLKKFNSKVLYIASGVYSIIINGAAFGIGCLYFTHPSPVFQILFIVFLFLIGIQFGASNLLPSMLQADVLEEIELNTGKRLDASLPFVISIGTLISGTIAGALSPFILYGDKSIIGYIQPTEGVYPEQAIKTKVMMLFFYTVFHGIMMFLAGVPFFAYDLTGDKKAEMHDAVLEYREKLAAKNGETVAEMLDESEDEVQDSDTEEEVQDLDTVE